MQATDCGPSSLALEAADVGGDQARGELGVLAERVHDPRPAWLGRQVGHRVERDVDADRAVLAPRDVAELAHERPRRASAAEADRLGPLREPAGRPARPPRFSAKL